MTSMRRILAYAPLLGAIGLAQAQDPAGTSEPMRLSSQPQYADMTEALPAPAAVLAADNLAAYAAWLRPAESSVVRSYDPETIRQEPEISQASPATAPSPSPFAARLPALSSQFEPVIYGESADNASECVACAPHGPIRRIWHCRTKPCLQATHWGYPEEFGGRPFGTYAQAALDAQIANGYAAQLTLYRYDFSTLDGLPSDRLNARGHVRLVRLSELLAVTPYPLVIEYDELHPRVNEARRQHVLAQLEKHLGSIDDHRVIVAPPVTRGLSAEEASAIHENLLQQSPSGAAERDGASMSSGIGISLPLFGAGGNGGASGSGSSFGSY